MSDDEATPNRDHVTEGATTEWICFVGLLSLSPEELDQLGTALSALSRVPDSERYLRLMLVATLIAQKGIEVERKTMSFVAAKIPIKEENRGDGQVVELEACKDVRSAVRGEHVDDE